MCESVVLGLYQCPNCKSEKVVESFYSEDGEDIPCARCRDCGDWGNREKFVKEGKK